MLYHRPILELAALRGPQTKLQDKLGGLPWGLPPNRWPTCASCGGAQSLLAQLSHRDGVLDLGRAGRVLFVFQCAVDPGCCEEWDLNAGANACFMLESDALGDGPTAPPNSNTPVHAEGRVLEWRAAQDPVDEARRGDFFSDEAYGRLPEELLDGVPGGVKLGSVPAWIQSAGEGPGPEYRFVLQLGEQLELDSAPPKAAELGCTVSRKLADGRYQHDRIESRRPGSPFNAVVLPDGNHWTCEWGANFGGGGLAYVFVSADPRRLDGRVFFQC